MRPIGGAGWLLRLTPRRRLVRTVACGDCWLFPRRRFGSCVGDEHPCVGFLSARSSIKSGTPGTHLDHARLVRRVSLVFMAGARLSRSTEARMSIIFTCENCGKRFQVDERTQGQARAMLTVRACHADSRGRGRGASRHAPAARPSRRRASPSNSVRPSLIPWPASVRPASAADPAAHHPWDRTTPCSPWRLPSPARMTPHANERTRPFRAAR